MGTDPLGRLVRFVRDMLRLYGQGGIARSAAALSYFFLLSFFPLLLCLNSLVGLFRMDIQQLLTWLEGLLPRGTQAVIRDYVAYAAANQSPGLLYAGLFTILVSASAGLRVLLDTLDELYGHPRQTGLRRLAASVLLSLLFLVTVYFSLAVILTGDWLLGLLQRRLPRELAAALVSFSRVWGWMRYLLLFCFVILLVLAVYLAGIPRGAVSRPSLLISALVSALTLVGASGLFSRFIDMSSRYSLVYGSLASLILLLVWLYLCGTILLLGAVFYRVWTGGPHAEHNKEDDHT